MITKITINSPKEKINKFWEQRGSSVRFWKCLNCGKIYNSENAIRKEQEGREGIKKIFGCGVSVLCCPYCKIEQINKKAKWLKSEMKHIIIYGKWKDKGKERKVINLKSKEELKKLKEVLK